jgi:hypothetical protein
VLDLDIKAFFDTIPHDLLLKAVRAHTDCRWVLLYVERWLTAPVQREDGGIEPRDADLPPIIKTQSGAVTPQGIGSALSLSEDCSAVLALTRTRRAGCRRCRKRHPGQRLCATLCRPAGWDDGMVAAVEQRDWRDGHAAAAGTVV